jgi:hypothetical protein
MPEFSTSPKSYVCLPQDLWVLSCHNLETGERGIVVTRPFPVGVLAAAESYREVP